MKRLVTLAILLSLIVPQLAVAGSNADGFGLGIIVGEPTGVDAKWWLSESSALQGAVAWSFSGNSNMHIHLDYIMHRFDIIDVSSGSMPLYFGIGGRVKFTEDADDDIGLRIPIGLSYMFANDPFDLFVEIVPILDLIPDTDFDINAAIGGRFYF